MKTSYFTDFFAATYKTLHTMGLPEPEIILLKDTNWASPYEHARAVEHAYRRAMAIENGMIVLYEGLCVGAFHMAQNDDETVFWFIPQPMSEGIESRYSTYGPTEYDAMLEYVLAHMVLPTPIGDWIRDSRG